MWGRRLLIDVPIATRNAHRRPTSQEDSIELSATDQQCQTHHSSDFPQSCPTSAKLGKSSLRYWNNTIHKARLVDPHTARSERRLDWACNRPSAQEADRDQSAESKLARIPRYSRLSTRSHHLEHSLKHHNAQTHNGGIHFTALAPTLQFRFHHYPASRAPQ